MFDRRRLAFLSLSVSVAACSAHSLDDYESGTGGAGGGSVGGSGGVAGSSSGGGAAGVSGAGGAGNTGGASGGGGTGNVGGSGGAGGAPTGGGGGTGGATTGGGGGTGGATTGGGGGTGGSTGGTGGGSTGGTGGGITGGTGGGSTGGSGGTGGGTPVCGNNKLEAGEECDDGGKVSTDGCDATCKVVCTDKNATAVPYTVNGRIHCYWRIGSSNSYNDSSIKCQQATGGHLATILTSGENAFVLGLCPSGDSRCWIGLTDGQVKSSATQGTYGWVTSEAMSYMHWQSGEPNWASCGAGCYQHRGTIRTSDGYWEDRSQDDSFDGICEWDPKP